MRPCRIGLLLTAMLLLTHPASHAKYKISKSVIGSGGTDLSGGTVVLRSTVGEANIGLPRGTILRNDVGFWYAIRYVATGIESGPSVPPRTCRLEQNYPNPFNPVTTIKFMLPEQRHVSLKVYDVRGKEVAKLVDKEMEEGVHRVLWDAQNMASGVYFYQIVAHGFVQARKLVVLK